MGQILQIFGPICKLGRQLGVMNMAPDLSIGQSMVQAAWTQLKPKIHDLIELVMQVLCLVASQVVVCQDIRNEKGHPQRIGQGLAGRRLTVKSNTLISFNLGLEIYYHFRLNYLSILITMNLLLNGSKLLRYVNLKKVGLNYGSKLPR